MKHSITNFTALLSAIFLVGCSGMRRHLDPDMVGTKRVLAMAQPTEQAAPHRLQRLQAAFLRDDGTLLLQIQGKPVNEAMTQRCTLEIPPPKRPAPPHTLASRIEVPGSALRMGWDKNVLASPNHREVSIGPVLIIQANEAYVWDALAPTAGRDEEIRLVQRLGDAAKAFYGAQFGWIKDGEMDMGPMGNYEFLKASGDRFALGAVMPKMPEMPVSAWSFYFRVPDIDVAVASITANGGTMLQEPMEIPGGDFSISALDPQGAAFGLVGPRR